LSTAGKVAAAGAAGVGESIPVIDRLWMDSIPVILTTTARLRGAPDQ
jgi:hypothetical protein